MNSEPEGDLIVASAQQLFYARGFHAVGMDEICAAAGVSLKKLYRNFPSKEAVFIEVITRWHEQWTTALTSRTAAAATPRDRLLTVYDFLADWFETDSFRGCGFINAFGELGATSKKVATLAHDHKISFQHYMRKLVTQAGAPEYLAAQLSILAEGALTTAAISGNAVAAHQAREAAEVLIGVALHRPNWGAGGPTVQPSII